ncbi:MAG: transketolase [Deltaproteobacteria bacterium]|nr:transketolase [Deltaproteobacteria bacterium]
MHREDSLQESCINTLRFLAVDAVQQARSGHPGAPMGAAPMAFVLWDRFLKHNPANPAWPDRDRFVLSAGHASMLLYALLHLTGYDLPLEEIRNFRQWESRTPGHPEYGVTPGVEVTTGPLGQGLAHAVGMALAERWLAAHFNRPGFDVVNHRTYALVSDGDMQEGVAGEAASIAGTLGLGKLICLYDDNGIQIEGSTRLTFREDVALRFRAYGWAVSGPIDGFDLDAVHDALRTAVENPHQPSLIICRTVIGYGSPLQGTAKVHGEPLGEENARAAKLALHWPEEPTFHVPREVLQHMRMALERGQREESRWNAKWKAYRTEYPEEAEQLEAQFRGELPAGWDCEVAEVVSGSSKPAATRVSSGLVLNALAKRIPFLIGGSADLAPSTKTLISGRGDQSPEDVKGGNLHFGVREHAMGAIAGGMALHGGLIPYCATFLTFSDYMRPPMRLAALMGIRVIYVFTHDGIGLGEDGPTHQPVEQLMGLRTVPGLTVIRPADAAETAEAWRAALLNARGPTALVLSRQDVPQLDRSTVASAHGLHRGAYILWESGAGKPQVIIMGTGSEVSVALEAGRMLAEEGVAVRVVSVPSWELFDRQDEDYRELVLPRAVTARVAVEAGVGLGWEHYTGLRGDIVAMRGFGASAPGEILYERFGITSHEVAKRAKRLLGER